MTEAKSGLANLAREIILRELCHGFSLSRSHICFKSRPMPPHAVWGLVYARLEELFSL